MAATDKQQRQPLTSGRCPSTSTLRSPACWTTSPALALQSTSRYFHDVADPRRVLPRADQVAFLQQRDDLRAEPPPLGLLRLPAHVAGRSLRRPHARRQDGRPQVSRQGAHARRHPLLLGSARAARGATRAHGRAEERRLLLPRATSATATAPSRRGAAARPSSAAAPRRTRIARWCRSRPCRSPP